MKQQIGKRIQLKPHLDRWMMGDRYGEITGISYFIFKNKRFPNYKVHMDKSNQDIKLHPNNIEILNN
jgi:hypothetical protein